MSCDNQHQCNCTYPCDNHAKCCECIKFHRNCNELPACFFSAEAEKRYNLSIDYFVQLHRPGTV